MEEGIYRMSLTESFLVLIIIGLWLFAVINLARKLERICNPPSSYPNYSIHNKTSLSPSTLHERYPNNSIQPIRSSLGHFVRATSEPTIDASPRATIHIRSPSETCLYAKLSISEQVPSSNTLELGESNTSFNVPSHNCHRSHVETIPNKPIQPQPLLNPRRIPAIVRRSLLDLHRRALISNTSSRSSVTRCVATTTENQLMVSMNRFPLMKKSFQQENAIDEDDC
jgi:hypothetical protein